MQVLGEGLGQAVRQCLGHDRAVVVVLGGEPRGQLVDTEAGRHRERADVVVRGSHEVGQREIRLVVAMVDLLAQHREAHAVFENDVVSVSARRPEAVDATRVQQALRLDLAQQLLRVTEQLARRGALRRAVEDCRVLALELPRVEEERPVDVLAQRFEIRLDGARACERRLWQRVEINPPPAFPGSVERQHLALDRCVLRAQLFLQCAVVAVELGAPARVEEVGHDANDARCIEHVHGRAAVRGCDAHRGVLLGGCRTTDQQWDLNPASRHLLGHVDHLVERGCDEARQSHRVGTELDRGVQDAVCRHHHA